MTTLIIKNHNLVHYGYWITTHYQNDCNPFNNDLIYDSIEGDSTEVDFDVKNPFSKLATIGHTPTIEIDFKVLPQDKTIENFNYLIPGKYDKIAVDDFSFITNSKMKDKILTKILAHFNNEYKREKLADTQWSYSPPVDGEFNTLTPPETGFPNRYPVLSTYLNNGEIILFFYYLGQKRNVEFPMNAVAKNFEQQYNKHFKEDIFKKDLSQKLLIRNYVRLILKTKIVKISYEIYFGCWVAPIGDLVGDLWNKILVNTAILYQLG